MLDRITRMISRLRAWIRLRSALRGVAVFRATLSARHYIAAEDKWIDKGIICTRVVTDEFVELLVDELQASAPAHTRFFDFKFHDSGTGVGAEAAGDTALGTPTGEARDTGTQVEGASANIYKTVATHTYAGTFAVTEHGLFSAASAPDELMDRSVFAAINVVSGDKIEFTYELTCGSGG
ncbi:hypothetical protein LCGC14_2764710 [marine sediment metagenome]|uniref:Uncharacterized protein n=1 Tax=marine sediment metagenome TaxID=412755 RepID=A0A0F9B6I8_9ZZZZ